MNAKFIHWRNIVIERNISDLGEQPAIGRVPSNILVQIDHFRRRAAGGCFQRDIGIPSLIGRQALKRKQNQAGLVELDRERTARGVTAGRTSNCATILAGLYASLRALR